MVDIDGNAVPCVVLAIELGTPGSVRLEDTGSGRNFWRSVPDLLSCPRFGNLVTHRAYSDRLKHTAPDVKVRWLPPAGTRKPAAAPTITVHTSEAAADAAALVERASSKMSPSEMLALLTALAAD